MQTTLEYPDDEARRLRSLTGYDGGYVTPNYLDSFFGDPSLTAEIPDDELMATIEDIIAEWNRDYDPEIDPSAEEIFKACRREYPYNGG